MELVNLQKVPKWSPFFFFLKMAIQNCGRQDHFLTPSTDDTGLYNENRNRKNLPNYICT